MASKRNLRKEIRAEKRQPRSPRQPRNRKCDVSGKKGFAAKTDALTVLARNKTKAFKRAYLCSFCGRWHLTSEEKRGVEA